MYSNCKRNLRVTVAMWFDWMKQKKTMKGTFSVAVCQTVNVL